MGEELKLPRASAALSLHSLNLESGLMLAKHGSLEPRETDLASGPRSLSCQWAAMLLGFRDSTLSLLQTYLFPFICPYILPSFP